MTTDNKTLADAQPGGRVRLGDQAERARFEAWVAPRRAIHGFNRCEDMWDAWQAALSAQPSPGGQDAARYERLFLSAVGMLTKISLRLGLEPNSDGVEPMLAAIDALAARQPVGEIDEAAVLRRAAAVLYMWEDDPNLTGYMGDFNDACGILELLAQHAAPPAQAVDLPYSLDADPAGIRARVCDVITGTLMVGAQGHTPPPAGHWAEPFWRAALADAGLQVKMREALWAAARSLRTIADSPKETEFLETAHEIRAYANSRATCAEQAVTDSQAVGK